MASERPTNRPIHTESNTTKSKLGRGNGGVGLGACRRRL